MSPEEHVVRCRVERGYGGGGDAWFAVRDAIFLLDALDCARAGADAAEAAVARVEKLADRYDSEAQSEGYGGEPWSTTAAAIHDALVPSPTSGHDGNPV